MYNTEIEIHMIIMQYIYACKSLTLIFTVCIHVLCIRVVSTYLLLVVVEVTEVR